jgi:hypothetical protein
MRLKVLKPATNWRGRKYGVGEMFEVDEAGHNVASQVRFLKAVGRVEEVAEKVAPVGRVATTSPPQPPPAEPEERDEAPADDDREPPKRRGRYQRRDLTAD